MRRRYDSSRAFTLVELLVVIAIIGLLAAILLPTLTATRERARQTVCLGNLRQFMNAITMYMNDFGDYPPWLSTLYPKYIDSKKVYVCPSDPDQGRKGPMPSWSTGSKYEEAADIPGGTDPAQNSRNADIEACSYLYEFNESECSWWKGGDYPDKYGVGNKDGRVSWREVKVGVEQRGLQEDGSYSKTECWGGHVPIVRCFWHTESTFGAKSNVLNLASGDGNVFRSGLGKDDWKKEFR